MNEDIPPDAGKRPPFAKPDVPRGEIGTKGGYSGQEYDGVGQQAWREAEAEREVAPDGVAQGSGSPAEEYDADLPLPPGRGGDDAGS